MKKIFREFQDMSINDILQLTTVFMSTLLGTAGNMIFVSWMTEMVGPLNGLERFVVSIVSTVLYFVIILGTLYVLWPPAREAIKSKFNDR
ncbi:MAG: hypothetical protein L0332_28890 [Chloroflexi bacterium]|nr:hypothetical protein [Chloroflexota bacterium]MCI0647016.1 hypothetical protein [Chloroflexota bacterium]MCI0730716.1 hypothetical protein [Chloroflexota bacterium]